jgi:transposase
MPDPSVTVEDVVTGGVDTHADTHHAAALDALGRVLGDAQFSTDQAGCLRLWEWLAEFGQIAAVGVEGTGSYGKGVARLLRDQGVRVVEVNRPDRKIRRRKGKSDPIDAVAAARAVLSGDADAIPKGGDGAVEAVRALRVARSGAVKARTATINELKALVTTGPASLQTLRGEPTRALLAACAALCPDLERLADPIHATMLALRTLAHRHAALDKQVHDLDAHLGPLIAATAPTLISLYGVGPDSAGQLLATAGDNPQRLAHEASFAHLCAAAPIPASSGRTDRHRLNRGGDRQANAALHRIAIVRMRHCPRTRAYVDRRTQQGLSKKDIIRCLKRYIARQTHAAITKDLAPRSPAAT